MGISHQTRTTLAVATLLSSVAISFAQESSSVASANGAERIPAICADRHVQLAALIEDLGDAPNFAGDRLFKALLAMTRAYGVCVKGHEAEALAHYNQTVLDLVSPASLVR